jgi:hypothetical protein
MPILIILVVIVFGVNKDKFVGGVKMVRLIPLEGEPEDFSQLESMTNVLLPDDYYVLIGFVALLSFIIIIRLSCHPIVLRNLLSLLQHTIVYSIIF